MSSRRVNTEAFDVGYYFHNDHPETLTPDVTKLFQFYDAYFFSDVLEASEVKWSKRMTLCAGTCKHSAPNSCVITLSESILQFRNSNELKETLLHEMIHGYLFLTNPKACLEEGGHGKAFKDLMHFINEITHLNITVFHNFLDEVDQFRRHVWKCDGPCQAWPPHFGIVKRAMNRKPQKSDDWFDDHQNKCGGNFIKIEEPANYANKKETQMVRKTKSSKTASEDDASTQQKGNQKKQQHNNSRQESLSKFFQKKPTATSDSKKVACESADESSRDIMSNYLDSRQYEEDGEDSDDAIHFKTFVQFEENPRNMITPSNKQPFSLNKLEELSRPLEKNVERPRLAIPSEKEFTQVQIEMVCMRDKCKQQQSQENAGYFQYLITSDSSLYAVGSFLQQQFTIPNDLRSVIKECVSGGSDERLRDLAELTLGSLANESKMLFDFGNIKMSLQIEKRKQLVKTTDCLPRLISHVIL